ncbi:MAG TPA: GAF domain-containing sensor histidine kinase [Longimicrobiales bacterium]|nr:GAF domain-containing sensor histidine kinase [Longimicrobiales bacterium]
MERRRRPSLPRDDAQRPPSGEPPERAYLEASFSSMTLTERRNADARLRLLAEAGRVLTASLDYRATLASVTRMLVPGMGDWCAVDLVNEGGEIERVEVAHADPAKVALAWRLHERYPPDQQSPGRLVLRTGEPLLIPEMDEGLIRSAAHDAEHGEILLGLGVRSLVVVPLVGRSRTLGVITLASAESGRRYEPADVEMLRSFAGRTALAIETAHLFEAERAQRELAERAAERERRLQRVGTALSSLLEPEAVAQVVVEEAVDVLGATSGAVALRAGDDDLEIVASVGYEPEVVERFQRFPLSAPLPLAEAVRTGAPVELASREERRARFPLMHGEVAAGENRAWLALPLRVEQRVIGALSLGFRRPEDLEADERVFLATLAGQCAQALERARLYDAERRARADAEAANRTKAEFLARMSHELRTPLNAIAGYADLMELGIHGDISDAQRAALHRIKSNQRHLVALITDILDFAKQESGHLEIDLEEVPVNETLARVGPLIEPQIRARRLHYTYHPGDPAVTCRADPERLLQVLLNLVGNAVKFTGPGGEVHLEWSAGADSVEVRVRDTGRGIPADKLDAIFEPFFQVQAGHTREGGGTGLGLSISRELARAMGGDIAVESELERGSTFTLTLPRA